MTPKAKSANSTTIVIERKSIPNGKPNGNNVHVAGGDHKGIVINKVAANNGMYIISVNDLSAFLLIIMSNLFLMIFRYRGSRCSRNFSTVSCIPCKWSNRSTYPRK